MSPPREITIRHEISLHHRIGALTLAVDFTLTKPWTALFAPSGGGKTTVLRMIAGLDRPQAGNVTFRSTWPPRAETKRVLVDAASKIFVEPHRRGVGMVAQQPALFPHRSVLGNVRYGVFSGRDTGEGEQSGAFVEDVLTLCRVEHLREKRTSDLSGGERQRVALARTLAAGNLRFLLLDEPFTGIELGLREELIRDLRTWLRERNIPVLMVTHDLGEAFATEAEVVRMAQGRIVAQGPPSEVLAVERARLRGLLG